MCQHKCIDCGFLAYRDFNTRELDEVERKEDGTYKNSSRQLQLICFMRAFNLQSEYKIDPPQIGKIEAYNEKLRQRVNEVVNQTRECKHFTEWQQGFTPKEHKEMLDREWMIKYQEEREDADKKWRRNQDWKLVIVAGIFTILGSVLAWLLTR